jgi:hypothetical protein
MALEGAARMLAAYLEERLAGERVDPETDSPRKVSGKAHTLFHYDTSEGSCDYRCCTSDRM